MFKTIILLFAILISNPCFSQDLKKPNARIVELEKRVAILEKKLSSLAVSSLKSATLAQKTFNIKYELESEDKDSEFLIMYWDKEGQPRGAWAKSGWKLAFATSDISQNIQIQGKPSGKDTKKLTVKIYVDNKLVKSDSKELKLASTDGPYCQVLLSEL